MYIQPLDWTHLYSAFTSVSTEPCNAHDIIIIRKYDEFKHLGSPGIFLNMLEASGESVHDPPHMYKGFEALCLWSAEDFEWHLCMPVLQLDYTI